MPLAGFHQQTSLVVEEKTAAEPQLYGAFWITTMTFSAGGYGCRYRQ